MSKKIYSQEEVDVILEETIKEYEKEFLNNFKGDNIAEIALEEYDKQFQKQFKANIKEIVQDVVEKQQEKRVPLELLNSAAIASTLLGINFFNFWQSTAPVKVEIFVLILNFLLIGLVFFIFRQIRKSKKLHSRIILIILLLLVYLAISLSMSYLMPVEVY